MEQPELALPKEAAPLFPALPQPNREYMRLVRSSTLSSMAMVPELRTPRLVELPKVSEK